MVWFTGLPASGKTTLARRTATRLSALGQVPIVLDSDALRPVLAPSPGYAPKARARFYEALAEFSALLARQGQVVLVAATANRRAYRARAKRLAPRFLEVFVDASLADCAARDPKGLYRRAARGQAPALPGVGTAYEAPRHADVVARGGRDAAAVARVLRLLGERKPSRRR